MQHRHDATPKKITHYRICMLSKWNRKYRKSRGNAIESITQHICATPCSPHTPRQIENCHFVFPYTEMHTETIEEECPFPDTPPWLYVPCRRSRMNGPTARHDELTKTFSYETLRNLVFHTLRVAHGGEQFPCSRCTQHARTSHA